MPLGPLRKRYFSRAHGRNVGNRPFRKTSARKIRIGHQAGAAR